MLLNSSFKKFYAVIFACSVFFTACTKQETLNKPDATSDSSAASQINYISTIKSKLKDSLSTKDFAAVNFGEMYTARDVRTHNYFIRIGFYNSKIADDFVLLKADSNGNIIKAKIIHIQWGNGNKNDRKVVVETSSLNRKEIKQLRNTSQQPMRLSAPNKSIRKGEVSSLMAQEEPVGEQVLPDVVVTGYIYCDPVPYYWYWYDGMLGIGGGTGTTYTYGSAYPENGGGGGGDYENTTLQIDYEYPENVAKIDIQKYLNCFGSMQEAGATYTITIATDIPVDGDPSQFFNWSNASPGHTYVELYKNTGLGVIEQNIGFYPNSSWKTVGGSSIGSKIGDDANHEYNARYTVSVNAEQFQSAINTIQLYSAFSYNISTFNCTDFALNVFNAAGGNLSIPKYQIPGYPNGTTGSNTPQGLYMQLNAMAAVGNTGVKMPGIKGYGSNSHGPCNLNEE